MIAVRDAITGVSAAGRSVERISNVGRGAVTSRPLQAGPIVPFSLAARSMGGRLVVHLDADGRTSRRTRTAARDASSDASRDAHMAVARIDRWAARLTRFTDASELARLNADPSPEVLVGPTLAAALRAGIFASQATGGLADVALLNERLAAEGLEAMDAEWASGLESHDWSLVLERRGSAIVRRSFGLRFDFGGVGKGWIADRALNVLTAWPSAVIDADGDLAVRCAPGKSWEVAIEDPREPDRTLAVLRLSAASNGIATHWGVATSGTSIHRWTVGGAPRHHLIDPRTGEPALTDVVQATVIAGTALHAEALAKAAVIAGTVEGFALLERAGVRGAVVLTERGETLALPRTTELLTV